MLRNRIHLEESPGVRCICNLNSPLFAGFGEFCRSRWAIYRCGSRLVLLRVRFLEIFYVELVLLDLVSYVTVAERFVAVKWYIVGWATSPTFCDCKSCLTRLPSIVYVYEGGPISI